METDKNHWDGLVVCTGIIGVVVCLMGAASSVTTRYHRTEAVKRGHAYWHVNENGTTEFKWKEETK